MTVAEILGNKKRGLKIYDLLHRIVVEFDKVTTTCNDDESETVIWCKNGNTHFSYSEDGTERGWLDGMQILKPSECMQDWDKLAWKQGEVLVDSDGTYAMFDGWSEDDFSEFNTKYSATPLGNGKFSVDEDRIYLTSDFDKIEDREKDELIKILEKEYNGKFNPETLEIDGKPNFKEGDFVYIQGDEDKGTESIIFIYKNQDPIIVYCHAVCRCESYNDNLLSDRASYVKDATKARLATEEEKQLLLSKLASIGKKWDADKKQIVDIPKKPEFKPFQKVLVRDESEDRWQANFYSCIINNTEFRYGCVCEAWKQCIPYEGNEHLLGTTDDCEDE